jgi:hypothetical protein
VEELQPQSPILGWGGAAGAQRAFIGTERRRRAGRLHAAIYMLCVSSCTELKIKEGSTKVIRCPGSFKSKERFCS